MVLISGRRGWAGKSNTTGAKAGVLVNYIDVDVAVNVDADLIH